MLPETLTIWEITTVPGKRYRFLPLLEIVLISLAYYKYE